MTYYYPTGFPPGDKRNVKGAYGACGEQNTNNDMIIAIPAALYDSNDYCGRKVKITANGKSLTVTVKDRCPGCQNGHIDVAPPVFTHFASEGNGVYPIEWTMM
ncbi:hypothetical protein FRB94_008616 [Tulasnella sp. JGI-2019a]|nr:hypothetical protein FRB93_001480 [Tulasnella sp. JGI-2019a]KAG8995976.1 hypothetical protein FRB94_008616 [Tulasnella sp. JGI-2019a]KAG9033297.1 hypothetical protein FRB95_000392 [Tulasnella sp. JGI-2019a]